MFHSTTILAVRHRDKAVIAGDGQVTLGDTIVKQSAKKIRRLYNGQILAGFAGSAADSFALFSRFESKLEQCRGNLERAAVELGKEWGTDRVAPVLLPGATLSSAQAVTPRQIVSELDKYVVGQAAAKRAVAIALRNRMRRQKLSPALAEEIAPKNILMIGPTAAGKTEIARRLARLAQSPFIKVEASKVTGVGYVGRAVASMR